MKLATSEKLLRCCKQHLSWHYNSMIDSKMENKVSVETELRNCQQNVGKQSWIMITSLVESN